MYMSVRQKKYNSTIKFFIFDKIDIVFSIREADKIITSRFISAKMEL